MMTHKDPFTSSWVNIIPAQAMHPIVPAVSTDVSSIASVSSSKTATYAIAPVDKNKKKVIIKQ